MTPAPPDQSYGKRHAEPPFRRIFQRVQWFARPAASPCVGNFLAAGLVQKHPTSYAAEVDTPPVLITFDLLYVKRRDVSRPPLRDRRAGSRISSATPT